MSSVRLLFYGLWACLCAKVLCHLPVFGINALMTKIASIRIAITLFVSVIFIDIKRLIFNH